MPTTNGHGPKTAVLYARVSTDEQARSGYSLAQPLDALPGDAAREGARVPTDGRARSGYALAQQLEALRGYAAREGYRVVEGVADPGQSGASLERPGMDRGRER